MSLTITMNHSYDRDFKVIMKELMISTHGSLLIWHYIVKTDPIGEGRLNKCRELNQNAMRHRKAYPGESETTRWKW